MPRKFLGILYVQVYSFGKEDDDFGDGADVRIDTSVTMTLKQI